MATAVKLSDDLVDAAKLYGAALHRSIPKQIEYWAMLGKIAEENPDLQFVFIQEILLGLQEANAGKLSVYSFE